MGGSTLPFIDVDCRISVRTTANIRVLSHSDAEMLDSARTMRRPRKVIRDAAPTQVTWKLLDSGISNLIWRVFSCSSGHWNLHPWSRRYAMRYEWFLSLLLKRRSGILRPVESPHDLVFC
jgi:hypothetical protein